MTDFAGWWPTHLQMEGNETIVTWHELGDTPLTQPFFEHTVAMALEHDPPSLRTTLDESLDVLEALPSLEPHAFIAHMSRSGSTLLGRMLAADPGNRVVSESMAASWALAPPAAVDEERRLRWFAAILRALGQPTPGQYRFIVKLKPRDALQLGLVRRGFPDTPWVFLHRDPVEVLVSVAQRPPTWLGCRDCLEPIAGVDDAVPVEVRAARILAAFCDRAREALDDRALVIDYADALERLPEILHHFGLPADRAWLAIMRAVSGVNAKRPNVPFRPDGAEKQRLATPAMRQAAATFAAPARARLVAATTRAAVAA